MENESKEFDINKLEKQIEELINCIADGEMEASNIKILGELIDMHKDLKNEKYWEIKEEKIMRYRDDSYGRRRRDSRGRFKDGKEYDRKYDGEEMIDGMYNGYQDYLEGREEYGRGNYGAKNDTMRSLEYMLQSVVEFVEMLKKDANSQDEVELIREYTRHISEM